MTTVQQKLPCSDNGDTLPYNNATAWQNQANAEIVHLHSRAVRLATSVAGTNAITFSSSPSITAYVNGQTWIFAPANNNTAAVDIDIDSVGSIDLLDRDGAELVEGSLIAGRLYRIMYLDGDMYVIDAIVPTQTVPFPDDYISGFITSNNVTDANNDIDITRGQARDYARSQNLETSSTFTKRMDAAYSQGTNNGGMLQSANLAGTITVTSGSATVTGSSTTFTTDFTVGHVIQTAGGQARRITVISSNTSMTVESTFGSTESGVTYKRGGKAKNTKYRLFAIGETGTSQTDFAFSPIDVPTDMPSGWSKYRRIAYVLTDSSANNRAYYQDPQMPEDFKLLTAITEATASDTSLSVVTVTSSAPPSVRAQLRLELYATPGAVSFIAQMSSSDTPRGTLYPTNYSGTPPVSLRPTAMANEKDDAGPAEADIYGNAREDIVLNASAQYNFIKKPAYALSTLAVNTTYVIYLLGWYDGRRRA